MRARFVVFELLSNCKKVVVQKETPPGKAGLLPKQLPLGFLFFVHFHIFQFFNQA